MHPELSGQRNRVHAAASAECDEREIAGVVAAVDRDQLERVDHVVVRDPDDASSGVLPVGPEPLRDRTERVVHGRHVGLDLAAAEEVLVDAAEREIGVGRRRLGAPTPVGRRAGHRAGGLRPDAQLAEVVDPGDAAAAVADLDEIDDRHHDRVARRRAISPDPVVGHDLDVAALDQ